MIAAGIFLLALAWLYGRLRSREHLALVALNSSFADWWDAAAGLCALVGFVLLGLGAGLLAWRLLP